MRSRTNGIGPVNLIDALPPALVQTSMEARPMEDEVEEASLSSRTNQNPTLRIRKSHRKSRKGCDNCKKAKKKCDESYPTCGGCLRRNILCNFATRGSRSRLGSDALAHGHQHSPASSGTPGRASSISDHARIDNESRLCYEDMELLHHYTTHPDIGLDEHGDVKSLWRIEIPKLAFLHHFALHLILAFAALHLATQQVDRREDLVARAEYHHKIGIRGLTEALRTLQPGNAGAVYMAAVLTAFCELAFGPKPGEYLVFNDSGSEATWLVFVKGVRSLMESENPPKLTPDPEPEHRAPASEPSGLLQPIFCPDYMDAFVALRKYILRSTIDDFTAANTYLEAYENLKEAYNMTYAGLRDSQGQTRPVSVSILRWLYLMSEDLAARLQRRQPLALVIFAHFAVLFREMERIWHAKGWPKHVLDGIHAHLPEPEKVHIQWVLDEMTKTPS